MSFLSDLVGGAAESVVKAFDPLGWLGDAVESVGKLFQPQLPDLLPPAAPAPTGVDGSAARAAAAEASALRKRKGVQSTLLTGPAGVTNPATTLKTILG